MKKLIDEEEKMPLTRDDFRGLRSFANEHPEVVEAMKAHKNRQKVDIELSREVIDYFKSSSGSKWREQINQTLKNAIAHNEVVR